MTTYLRAPEAARRLGVTTASLYSYVSRGRISRTLGSDGRSSLFDVDDVDALIAASSRPVPPPPTIDVRISTSITQLDEAGLRYRGVAVDELVDQPFEQVCGLLWNDAPGNRSETPDLRSSNPSVDVGPLNVLGIIRLATGIDRDLEPIDAATRLLGDIARTGRCHHPGASFAHRLAHLWVAEPSPQLVRAINSTLVLLADHGLATSTLAVRVATSVRASPISSLIAGLATVEGELHGAAAFHAFRLFEEIELGGAARVLTRYRCDKRRVPGFGHKIYRDRDPRFELLLDRVRTLPDPCHRLSVVDDTISAAGALVSRLPNIDLALGALAYVAGLPADLPLFAIARIAGWTAHHLEELHEPPVRFRGLAH
ncbi:MAG: citrate/2-methylcitrate synthase [Ilumatobacter sp.]|uniref:citrate/2-methylcitrate synthase n=1 Tax=Ilumatobacter sp. TaxID=1967498 RepID=UPI003C78C1EA